MKKKRNEKPSETIFPEMTKKQYLVRTCPDCGNGTFLVLHCITPATGAKAGLYRVKCTLCGFEEGASGKRAYTQGETKHKAGKVPQRPPQD